MSAARAAIYQHGVLAGHLLHLGGRNYRFEYLDDYSGPPVSFTMPLSARRYDFDEFPPIFEGLLPEGLQLEALLRINKLDRDDFMGQLLAVGADVVGSLTILADER